MQKPQNAEQHNAAHRQQWLKKWIALDCHCEALKKLEQEAFEFCSAVCKAPTKGYLLVIYGANGTGKTHAGKKIVRWLNRTAEKVRLVPFEESWRKANAVFENWPAVVDGFKKGQWTVIDDLMDATVSVLDDVGAEHDPSKIGLEKLYRVLSEREGRFTVLTTNILPSEWSEKFERRNASRLFRKSRHVDLTKVPDYSATK